MKEKVEEVVAHLNEKAGKKFRAVGKNESLIKGRLKDYSIIDMKRVIDSKCNQWIGDTKMESYLRPETLFNKSKFQNYFEQLVPEINEKLSQRQIEHRNYILTPKWLNKREAVIRRAGHLCEGCGIYLGEKGQVHHKTYQNWKDEFLFELIYLCGNCHTEVHKISGIEYEG